MRVLVCGGRSYWQQQPVFTVLDELQPTLIITGGAPGADHSAITWAAQRSVPWCIYPANWRKHGDAAGPLRNQQMLDEAKPDLVLAFPGGRGTADMLRRARSADIPTRQEL
jgi:hypothetical protein